MFAINDPIIHRAWKWKGIVIDFPWNMTPLGHVMVQREDGTIEECWIPTIMLDEDMEVDWS